MKKLSIALISIIMTLAFIPVSAFGEDVGEQTEPEVPAEPVITFDQLQPAAEAQVEGEGIRITWEEILSDSGEPVTYELVRTYKASTDPLTQKALAKTGNTTYHDKKVKSGKQAYYYVRAKSAGQYTLYSEAATAEIIRVYVETGHGIDSKGRWDSGCRWKKYQEAKLMIPIAKATTNYLRDSGIYVYTDAFSGNNKNLFKTLDFLDKHSVSVFLNIHCDYKKAKAGTLPLYRTSEQKKLAKALNKAVHQEVNIKNRGLQKRKDLKTLNSKKVHGTACLFETGCISKDNKILRKKYDAYGRGLAKGVCNYLGVEFNGIHASSCSY